MLCLLSSGPCKPTETEGSVVIGLQPEKFILCLAVSLKRGTDFRLLWNHIEVLLLTEGSKPDRVMLKWIWFLISKLKSR